MSPSSLSPLIPPSLSDCFPFCLSSIPPSILFLPLPALLSASLLSSVSLFFSQSLITHSINSLFNCLLARSLHHSASNTLAMDHVTMVYASSENAPALWTLPSFQNKRSIISFICQKIHEKLMDILKQFKLAAGKHWPHQLLQTLQPIICSNGNKRSALASVICHVQRSSQC